VHVFKPREAASGHTAHFFAELSCGGLPNAGTGVTSGSASASAPSAFTALTVFGVGLDSSFDSSFVATALVLSVCFVPVSGYAVIASTGGWSHSPTWATPRPAPVTKHMLSYVFDGDANPPPLQPPRRPRRPLLLTGRRLAARESRAAIPLMDGSLVQLPASEAVGRAAFEFETAATKIENSGVRRKSGAMGATEGVAASAGSGGGRSENASRGVRQQQHMRQVVAALPRSWSRGESATASPGQFSLQMVLWYCDLLHLIPLRPSQRAASRVNGWLLGLGRLLDDADVLPPLPLGYPPSSRDASLQS